MVAYRDGAKAVQAQDVLMKIVVSHDVDHIDGWCHWWRDFYWEKFLIKALLYFLSGKIGCGMFFRRVAYVFTRRIENIDELMEFDRAHNIPSTFFVGVNNALGMSYSLKAAYGVVTRIKANGFDVGVHGIAFDNKLKIKAEYKKFKSLGVVDSFGIRNHYLRGRMCRQMHEWQSEVGYAFDSTDYGLAKPFKIGNMWEFSLSIMDAYMMKDYDNDMKAVKSKTLAMLREAESKGLPFFIVLFHNPSPVFPDQYDWYKWLIGYLSENGYGFVSFKDAIAEMEK